MKPSRALMAGLFAALAALPAHAGSSALTCNGLSNQQVKDTLRSRVMLIQDIALHSMAAESCEISTRLQIPNYVQAFGFPACEEDDQAYDVVEYIWATADRRAKQGDMASWGLIFMEQSQLEYASRILVTQSGGCEKLLPTIDSYLQEQAKRR